MKDILLFIWSSLLVFGLVVLIRFFFPEATIELIILILFPSAVVLGILTGLVLSKMETKKSDEQGI